MELFGLNSSYDEISYKGIIYNVISYIKNIFYCVFGLLYLKYMFRINYTNKLFVYKNILNECEKLYIKY